MSQSIQVDQGRVEPATIVEPAFRLTNIIESQVMKTIRSLKPSKSKDVFGMDLTMLKDLGSILKKLPALKLGRPPKIFQCVLGF